MTPERLEEILKDTLQALTNDDYMDSADLNLEDCAIDLTGARVRTFEEAGVLTHNKGVVLHMSDGSEFQLMVAQSRGAK